MRCYLISDGDGYVQLCNLAIGGVSLSDHTMLLCDSRLCVFAFVFVSMSVEVRVRKDSSSDREPAGRGRLAQLPWRQIRVQVSAHQASASRSIITSGC